MVAKKTQEQFEDEVYKLIGFEYTFLEPYKNNKEKIGCRHNECGHIWKVSYGNFKNRGSRCPKCRYRKMSINNTKTDVQFINEVKELVGNEYLPLDKYTDSYTELRMQHNECGNVWLVKPISFTSSGRRCPKCVKESRRKIMRKGTDLYKKEVYNLVGNEYTVLGKYGRTNKDKIETIHQVCGYRYKVSPHEFINGMNRCPNCFGTPPKTHEKFKNEVTDLVFDEYTILGTYVSTLIPIKIRHNICLHEFNVTPNNFLRGSRCPLCNKYQSRGEQKIKDFLKDNEIFFVEEYSFSDLKNKRNLRFDFAVLGNNDDIDFLIEYDGIQHFRPVDFFGGEEALRKQNNNDKMKNEYCQENNINLIRIPYWEIDNIEKFLTAELRDKVNIRLGDED